MYCLRNESPVKEENQYSTAKKLWESTHKSQSLSHCSELNYTPEDTSKKSHYKFNCPICFKYFTNIYVSKCCKNYYWNRCHQELKDDARSKGLSSKIRCIFWGCSPLKLDKVNPDDSIKMYNGGPLKILQSKLSISGVFEWDTWDKRFPNSFIGISKF